MVSLIKVNVIKVNVILLARVEENGYPVGKDIVYTEQVKCQSVSLPT